MREETGPPKHCHSPHHTVPGWSGGHDSNRTGGPASVRVRFAGRRGGRGCIRTEDWRSQAGASTASRGHMLLYIPIWITLLWNVRKCVVSRVPLPQAHPSSRRRFGPLPHRALPPQAFPHVFCRAPVPQALSRLHGSAQLQVRSWLRRPPRPHC